jgi:hypothetical protein
VHAGSSDAPAAAGTGRSLADLLARADRTVTRELTADERTRYASLLKAH